MKLAANASTPTPSNAFCAPANVPGSVRVFSPGATLSTGGTVALVVMRTLGSLVEVVLQRLHVVGDGPPVVDGDLLGVGRHRAFALGDGVEDLAGSQADQTRARRRVLMLDEIGDRHRPTPCDHAAFGVEPVANSAV